MTENPNLDARDNSLEVERLILLKLCEERKLDVSDDVGKDLNKLKELLGMVVLPAADERTLGFEEQILRVFAGAGMITKSIYDAVLQRLKDEPQTSLGDALLESGAITPDVATALNDGKAMVDSGVIKISQFMVALFDYQTANIPIKESLSKRGWLKK